MVHLPCTFPTAIFFLSPAKEYFGLTSLFILPTLNYFLMAQTAANDVFVHKASKMDLQAPLGSPTYSQVINNKSLQVCLT